MKATFKDFLTEHPTCSQYANNTDAKAMFNFISEDENIISMIDVTEMGRPALLGCLREIENYFDSKKNSTFDLTDNFTRTAVGRMVATILVPFGYKPIRDSQKSFSQTKKGKYFGSASCYEKTGKATLRVVRTIEKV